MMKSMTAYGRATAAGADKDIAVELRSVNSRYLDLSVRIPHALAALEERIKGYIRSSVTTRGKLEVNISYETHAASDSVPTIDDAYLKGYLENLYRLRDTYGLCDDISVMQVAQNPAVFRTVRNDLDLDAEWERLLPVLADAAESYSRMRAAEGERIRLDLEEKLSRVSASADEIEKISRTDTVGYRDKLESRLRSILSDNSVEIDEGRLLTECAIYADRIAIDEELVRLRSHFGAFREIAAEKTPSGKKLDFLMQELNRETNTIGSKANNARIARLVVEMKNELEKIREQVQNIE